MNGKHAAVIVGTVLLALVTIFGFIAGIPFERKGAAAEVKADLQRELTEMRTDIREIRDRMRRWQP